MEASEAALLLGNNKSPELLSSCENLQTSILVFPTLAMLAMEHYSALNATIGSIREARRAGR